MVRSSTRYANVVVTAACAAASSANAIPYPTSRSSLESGIVISRSSVPVVRSRNIVIEVIRNIMISGNSPSIGGPIRSNVPGWSSNMNLTSAIRTHGTTRTIAIVRGSRRSCSSTRRATASGAPRAHRPPPPPPGSTSGTPSVRSSAPVRFRISSGGAIARNRPSRIRASMWQLTASSITWLETSSVFPSAASA